MGQEPWLPLPSSVSVITIISLQNAITHRLQVSSNIFCGFTIASHATYHSPMQLPADFKCLKAFSVGLQLPPHELAIQVIRVLLPGYFNLGSLCKRINWN